MKQYKYIRTEHIERYDDWEIVQIIPRSENGNANFCMAVIMKEDTSVLDNLKDEKDKNERAEEININFTGITDYLRDKDFEIDNFKYMNRKLSENIDHLQNIINKTTNYYLKTLSINASMPSEAVEMFNLLEGNK